MLLVFVLQQDNERESCASRFILRSRTRRFSITPIRKLQNRGIYACPTLLQPEIVIKAKSARIVGKEQRLLKEFVKQKKMRIEEGKICV